MNAPLGETAIKILVAEYISSQLEDRKVVEYEISEAIANRLLGWAKIFGVCLALPVTVLLAILSIYGIKGVSDFDASLERLQKKNLDLETVAYTTAAKVRADLTALTTQIDVISKDINPTLIQSQKLRDDLNKVVSEYKVLSASLADAKSEANKSTRILEEKVKRIETRLSIDQVGRVQSMINIFEYGTIDPDYSKTIQFTPRLEFAMLQGNKLKELFKIYSQRADVQSAKELDKYTSRIDSNDPALQSDTVFSEFLKRISADPAMHLSINEMFEKETVAPAVQEAKSIGIQSALGIATVLDSMVHGGWTNLRNQTTTKLGGNPSTGVPEKKWVREYLILRQQWLANHARPDLRTTANRPKAILSLVEKNNWELLPPISINLKSLDRPDKKN